MAIEYTTNLATNLFIIFTVYTVLNYAKVLLSKKGRDEHRAKRARMAELRAKEFKSIAEQKEFIDLRRPKSKPFSWKFKNVLKILLRTSLLVGLVIGTRKLWIAHVQYNFSLLFVMVYALLLPVVINYIMKRYGLQNDDITVFFK